MPITTCSTVLKLYVTPCKTNISPWKIGLPSKKIVFQPSVFKGYVCLFQVRLFRPWWRLFTPKIHKNHALFPHDGLFLSTPKMRPTTISVFGAPKKTAPTHKKLLAENFCHGGWGAGKVKPGGPTSVFGNCYTKLGGGFKYFSFSPLLGEMIQFDEHIFQMGWFNHQLVNIEPENDGLETDFPFQLECLVRFHVNLPVFFWRVSRSTYFRGGHSMGPIFEGENNLHANSFGNFWGISGFSLYIILLMEEIPNNHLGCRKPCKILGYLPYELGQPDFWTINRSAWSFAWLMMPEPASSNCFEKEQLVFRQKKLESFHRCFISRGGMGAWNIRFIDEKGGMGYCCVCFQKFFMCRAVTNIMEDVQFGSVVGFSLNFPQYPKMISLVLSHPRLSRNSCFFNMANSNSPFFPEWNACDHPRVFHHWLQWSRHKWTM